MNIVSDADDGTGRVIDCHQHFWQLERGDYHWLEPELKPLYQDFMPDDLQPMMRRLGVDGGVLIQAAQTVAESKFLLGLADNYQSILAVVGWVDMMSPSAIDTIADLATNKKLCGLRPMIQDIADINWMLDKKLTAVFNALISLDLSFDALVQPRHLKNLMILIERQPDLRVVVNHGAKPAIADSGFESWAQDLEIIASNSNARCKLSGLMVEAGKDWTASQLIPYIDHLFDCFGSERIMWGSDWPVINMVADYQQWLELCRQYVIDNCPSASNDIFYQVAADFYRLSITTI